MNKPTENREWALKYGDIGTEPVTVAPYVSADHYELEQKRLFRRAWLYAGRVEDIPAPGDYFVKEIQVCDANVLVVRGDDGEIRAFHNVCRHRGNLLVWDRCGAASGQGFTCRFHGWTFKSDGQLAGVPDEGQFFDFRKADYGLKPIATANWKGFIYVNLDPRPDETLEQYLGTLRDEPIANYPFESPTEWWSWKVDLACNWKVILDAFSEGYHAPFVHRQTIAKVATLPDNRMAHFIALKVFGRHRMFSVAGNPDHRPGEAAQLAFRYAPLWTRYRDHEVMKKLPLGVNPAGSGRWGFDAYYVFPNMMISMFGEWWHIHHFQPLARDRTLWELRVFFPKAKNAEQRFSQEYTKCLLIDNMLEDLSTVEGTQRGLASKAFSHFPLQDQEILIRHTLKTIDSFMMASPQRGV